MQQQIKKRNNIKQSGHTLPYEAQQFFRVSHTTIKLQKHTTHYTTTYNFIQPNKKLLLSTLTGQLNILISNWWQTEQYIQNVPKTKNSESLSSHSAHSMGILLLFT